MVGGPDQQDGYSDKIGDYQYTEVAIDYNAGYTAALCAMVQKYGGTTDPDFPPTETPKWDEFLVKASINQSAGSYTELKVFAMNHSAWPARTVKNLSYNYYFDISELVDAGYSINDVSVRVGYDQHASDKGAISISDPIQYSGNIYYVKLSFADGSVVMPTGQSEHRSECQFRISIPDNIQGVWDPTNDYSYQGLTQGGEDAMVETPYITMYDGDTLIWGVEPDGTKPDPTVTTTKPNVTTTTTTTTTTTATEPVTTTEQPDTTTAAPDTTTATNSGTTKQPNPNALYGDVNLDGSVTLADLVTFQKQQRGALDFNAQQEANADCEQTETAGSVDALDLRALLDFLIGKSNQLPV